METQEKIEISVGIAAAIIGVIFAITAIGNVTQYNAIVALITGALSGSIFTHSFLK